MALSAECTRKMGRTIQQTGATLMWIAGRERERVTKGQEMLAPWDSLWQADPKTGAVTPPGADLLNQYDPGLKRFYDAILAGAKDEQNVPGFDPDACEIDWLVFACSMNSIARLPDDQIAAAMKTTEVARSDCPTVIANDPAYAFAREPETKKGGMGTGAMVGIAAVSLAVIGLVVYSYR